MRYLKARSIRRTGFFVDDIRYAACNVAAGAELGLPVLTPAACGVTGLGAGLLGSGIRGEADGGLLPAGPGLGISGGCVLGTRLVASVFCTGTR